MGILDSAGLGFILDPADLSGSRAAANAADLSAQSSREAIEEQRRQFDLTRTDLQPFVDAGTDALGDFRSGIDQSPTAPTLNEFSFDPNSVLDNPNFQFLRDQGNIAADRVAGKNRNLGSGNRLLAAQEYGQGLSTNFLNSEFDQQRTINTDNNNRLLQQHSLGLQSFNDRLNRLGGLIDVGRGTGSTLGQIGANSASNIGQLQQDIGNAQASGVLGASQGRNSLLGTAATAAGYIYGGPVGGAAAGAIAGGGATQSFSPIGASDSQGFFS